MNYLEHNALVIELWGKQGTGQLYGAAASHGAEDEMDEIVAEANWREERQHFIAKIEELQAELEYAQIEKMSLEKDLTRISLKSSDTFMQPKKDAGMDDGVEVLVQVSGFSTFFHAPFFVMYPHTTIPRSNESIRGERAICEKPA
jgi:hypothetical protein